MKTLTKKLFNKKFTSSFLILMLIPSVALATQGDATGQAITTIETTLKIILGIFGAFQLIIGISEFASSWGDGNPASKDSATKKISAGIALLIIAFVAPPLLSDLIRSFIKW